MFYSYNKENIKKVFLIALPIFVVFVFFLFLSNANENRAKAEQKRNDTMNEKDFAGDNLNADENRRRVEEGEDIMNGTEDNFNNRENYEDVDEETSDLEEEPKKIESYERGENRAMKENMLTEKKNNEKNREKRSLNNREIKKNKEEENRNENENENGNYNSLNKNKVAKKGKNASEKEIEEVSKKMQGVSEDLKNVEKEKEKIKKRVGYSVKKGAAEAIHEIEQGVENNNYKENKIQRKEEKEERKEYQREERKEKEEYQEGERERGEEEKEEYQEGERKKRKEEKEKYQGEEREEEKEGKKEGQREEEKYQREGKISEGKEIGKMVKDIKGEIKNRVEKIKKEVEEDVGVSTLVDLRIEKLDRKVNSNLEELEQYVKEKTNVKVDLSEHKREISKDVKEISENIKNQRKNIEKRGGLELYSDSDKDNVSDYDEKNIYNTDPYNAKTAGVELADGEMIQAGFDPQSASLEQVDVEDPRKAGATTTEMFALENVEIKRIKTKTGEATSTKSGFEDIDEGEEALNQTLFKGKSLPNSFVTIYIFSTPIVVTVKADMHGKWSYTLDKELPNGEHKVYMASVNNTGKIIAKSKPFSFVKTAEAITFNRASANSESGSTRSGMLGNYMWPSISIFIFIVLLGIYVVGLLQEKKENKPRTFSK